MVVAIESASIATIDTDKHCPYCTVVLPSWMPQYFSQIRNISENVLPKRDVSSKAGNTDRSLGTKLLRARSASRRIVFSSRLRAEKLQTDNDERAWRVLLYYAFTVVAIGGFDLIFFLVVWARLPWSSPSLPQIRLRLIIFNPIRRAC